MGKTSILFSVICTLLSAGTAYGERLLILGDSLTAGYGVTREASYPARLEEFARAEGLDLQIVNGGMSGDTSAGGVRRLTWFLRQEPDLFLLALGGNDGLRGLPPAELEKNLNQILATVRSRYPACKLLVAGMEAPPNMGAEYRAEFRAVFARVAAQNEATLIPFLLDGVGGHPNLNQPDRIHPNEAGHELIAKLALSYVRPLLEASPGMPAPGA